MRFAPTLTGHLHLGDARLGVASWLLARAANGTLVLVPSPGPAQDAAEALLEPCLEDLRWLGVNWDEGPDRGGPYGPYLQWERSRLYGEYLEQLLSEGRAYRCYCTDEELRSMRADQLRRGKEPRYSGRCRNLTADDLRRFEKQGRPWRLRVRLPRKNGERKEGLGEIGESWVGTEDFAITKLGGEPLAVFRAAVDDGAMEIDAVVQTKDREQDARRQAVLMRLFGFRPPEFFFVPALLGPDGMPLSEKHGPVTVRGLRQFGFLGSAVFASLAELSGVVDVSPEETPLELARRFSPESLPSARSVFSHDRLKELNAAFLRAMNPQALEELAGHYLRENAVELPPGVLPRWLDLVRDRITLLSDLINEAEALLGDPDLSTPEARDALRREVAQKVLWSFLRRVQLLDRLSADAFRAAMRKVSEETGLLGRELWDPVRIALVGRPQEPKIAQIAEILGKERCEQRIRRALEVG